MWNEAWRCNLTKILWWDFGVKLSNIIYLKSNDCLNHVLVQKSDDDFQNEIFIFSHEMSLDVVNRWNFHREILAWNRQISFILIQMIVWTMLDDEFQTEILIFSHEMSLDVVIWWNFHLEILEGNRQTSFIKVKWLFEPCLVQKSDNEFQNEILIFYEKWI